MIYHYDEELNIERLFNSDAVAMVEMNHTTDHLVVVFNVGLPMERHGDGALALWDAIKREFDTVEWLERGRGG